MDEGGATVAHVQGRIVGEVAEIPDSEETVIIILFH